MDFNWLVDDLGACPANSWLKVIGCAPLVGWFDGFATKTSTATPRTDAWLGISHGLNSQARIAIGNIRRKRGEIEGTSVLVMECLF